MSKHHKTAVEKPEIREIYPSDAETIKNLIFRRGLDDKDENSAHNQKVYDYFVDQIVPKFAGGHAWGPNYRYTTPMYKCMQPSVGGRDPMKAVSIGDLVFCYMWFDNYGPGLEWNYKFSKGTLKKWPENNKMTKASARVSVCFVLVS